MDASLPSFVDFQSAFKDSLDLIKDSAYASLFDDIFPNASLCTGDDFGSISTWYGDVWHMKNNSTTPDAAKDRTDMCNDYQKECLLNTNWTIVDGWIREKSLTNDLKQFCPQPTTTTNLLKSVGLESTTPYRKSSASPPISARLLSTENANDSLTIDQSRFHTSMSEVPPQFPVTGNASRPFLADAGGDEPLKYLAFLTLLIPIVIVSVLVFRSLYKRRQKRKVGSLDPSPGSVSSLQSFPTTPTSTKDLIRPDDEETRKQKATKKRGRSKNVPRQQSTDSCSSTIHFADAAYDSAFGSLSHEEGASGGGGGGGEGEEGFDGYDDPDKERMKEDWTEKLDKLASMLTTSDGNVNLAMGLGRDVGEEEC